jgi:hypothetical protein
MAYLNYACRSISPSYFFRSIQAACYLKIMVNSVFIGIMWSVKIWILETNIGWAKQTYIYIINLVLPKENSRRQVASCHGVGENRNWPGTGVGRGRSLRCDLAIFAFYITLWCLHGDTETIIYSEVVCVRIRIVAIYRKQIQRGDP